MPNFVRNPHRPEWNAHCHHVREMLGLRPKQKLPREGIAAKVIDGVSIYVLSADAAKQLWPDVKKPHRMRGVCPTCGEHMSAGRLFQHKCKTNEGE